MNDLNYNIVKVATITGMATTSTIFLGWLTTSMAKPEYKLDWRDVAIIGSVGAMLGAHYSVTGKPWSYY